MELTPHIRVSLRGRFCRERSLAWCSILPVVYVPDERLRVSLNRQTCFFKVGDVFMPDPGYDSVAVE